MCGSWCAVMTVITVAVRLISDRLYVPIVTKKPFYFTTTRQLDRSLPMLCSSHSLSLSSFHFPIEMTPPKLTCASKMLIKQTHFSSTAKPNKRASTFPFKSEWQRNTTQQWRTLRLFIQGTSAARYSVENINFRCWGEEKRRAFCLPLLVWAWYAAWAFQAIC